MRYFSTTFDPGERDVLTRGETFNPLARAFRARTAEASITLGFEVLVQLVIAAMTTDPWVILYSFPYKVTLTLFLVLSAATPNPLNPF